MAGTALCLGGALVSGAVAGGLGWNSYKAFQTTKVLQQQKQTMQSNVVTTDNFVAAAPINQRVLFQHDIAPTAGSFVIDLSSQELKRESKLVPYQDMSYTVSGLGSAVRSAFRSLAEDDAAVPAPSAPVSAARAAVAGLGQLDVRTEVKSGLATQYESKLGLSHWKSLFAGRDFGLPKVMTAAESVGTELFNRDALGNPVEDVALSGGSQLQRILKDTYKVELPLRSDLGYGYKVYSLSGKTVYCIGQRVGQRFVYDRAAMDPITLVRKEFEPAEFDNTMVFGVGGAALFGSIAVACLFGASGGGGGGDGRDH